jgi:hypothetical protein
MKARRLGSVLLASALAIGLAGAAAIGEECADKKAATLVNDYPTATRGDYIYGCMLVNGSTPDVLEKCACSIDVIASILPFKQYEEAATLLSVRQRGGEQVAYMYAPAMQEKVRNMKRAQIEGEIRCF